MTDTVEEPDDTDLDSEWDVLVPVTAYVRVVGRPNPDYFEGWLDRDPEDAAQAAVLRGHITFERTDGFADLIGEAYVEDVSVDLLDVMVERPGGAG